MEIYKTEFIIKSESAKPISYKILSLIPIKYVGDDLAEHIKDYRVRYRLIYNECQSPISETKYLSEFGEKEIEEIINQSGVADFENKKNRNHRNGIYRLKVLITQYLFYLRIYLLLLERRYILGQNLQ